MKTAIIFGVCIAAFLLLITPTIPAQQYRLINDTIEKEFQQHVDTVLLALRTIVEDDAQIEYKKEVILVLYTELKQIGDLGGLDAVPTYCNSLIHTLLSLILALLGTLLGIIFGKLFGPLLVFIVKVTTFPAILFAKILEFLFNRETIIAV
jgi:hypothetical protein